MSHIWSKWPWCNYFNLLRIYEDLWNWFVKKGAHPNPPHLQADLLQNGPQTGQSGQLITSWVKSAIVEKVTALCRKEAIADVTRF